MHNEERVKKIRPDAVDMSPPESKLSSQQSTQNKQRLSLKFKGGVARLVLSTGNKNWTLDWCHWVWPMTGSPRQGPLDLLSGVNPAKPLLTIRSLYVLLVVLLSAWVLGAALRLSAEFAGWWVRWAMAVLSSVVLGGICILGVAEARHRPAAWSINTEVTEERDGVISNMGA